MKENTARMRQLFWEDVREQVRHHSPEFAEIIDELPLTKEHCFYYAEYPYGAMILDQGIFQIPNANHQIVPIHHKTIPEKIQNDLGYSGTIPPLGMVIENSIESFMRTKERIVPFSLFKTGQFISLWRIFDEDESFHAGTFWNITSGARSICMIPKITDVNSHKALKSKFGLKQTVPQKLREHWELFSKIANHSSFAEPWKSGLLFFSKKWFEHKKDKKWINFYHYLLRKVWQDSMCMRNQFVIDFVFSSVQQNRNLKPNPYLADTVRHLIGIGSGMVPGFATAIDNSAAPITGLQQVYIEDYGLKKYAPTIVHLHNFSLNEPRVVYYSFQIPTITVFSPKSRKLSSAMVELQEVKFIMDIFLSEILSGSLKMENTPIFHLAQNIKYGYYHSEQDKTQEISMASAIMNIDLSFTKALINKHLYSFPQFAPFFKGCISISQE